MCGWEEHHGHRECGCGEQHPGHHGPHGEGMEQAMHGCCHTSMACRCGHHGPFVRRFFTKEERIAWLEKYLEEVKAEMQAVEEHIARMGGQEAKP